MVEVAGRGPDSATSCSAEIGNNNMYISFPMSVEGRKKNGHYSPASEKLIKINFLVQSHSFLPFHLAFGKIETN